jgi:uncharacterized membrane protein YhaH (DUF805 family)
MGVPGPSVGGLLRGRANRREYWVIVGVVLAISFALSFVVPEATSGAGAAAVTYAQIRRLHDLGRTGWWVAAILGLQIVVTLVLLLALGLSEDNTLAIAGLLTLAPIVLLGALPGQPLENRFGPAPGQRPLKEIFS